MVKTRIQVRELDRVIFRRPSDGSSKTIRFTSLKRPTPKPADATARPAAERTRPEGTAPAAEAKEAKVEDKTKGKDAKAKGPEVIPEAEFIDDEPTPPKEDAPRPRTIADLFGHAVKGAPAEAAGKATPNAPTHPEPVDPDPTTKILLDFSKHKTFSVDGTSRCSQQVIDPAVDDKGEHIKITKTDKGMHVRHLSRTHTTIIERDGSRLPPIRTDFSEPVLLSDVLILGYKGREKRLRLSLKTT